MKISNFLLSILLLVGTHLVKAQDLSPKSDTMMVMDEEKGTEHGEVKWGYADKSGKWVVPPVYDYASAFTEGMATVGLYSGGWKYGFINEKGELAINLMYDVVGKFNEGLAYVAILNIAWEEDKDEKKYHKIGYIDKTNKMIISLPSQFCKPSGNCFYKGELYSKGFAKLKRNDKNCNTMPTLVIDQSNEVKVVKE